jgi:hypothetical protein
MATEEILDGPAKHECLSRMLSCQPVTFLVSGGSVHILIDEIQEIDKDGDRLMLSGHVVTDGHTGARVAGRYDYLTKRGRLVISVNGA